MTFESPYDYAYERWEAEEDAARVHGYPRRIGGSLYHENDLPDEDDL